mgnify:CR=1 FL=1
MFELKRLSPDSVAAALEKAERYRFLNEPMEAESICRDVLAIEPENQQALITLVLALTDQFDTRVGEASEEAHRLLARVEDDYSRLYFGGLACERRAKAHWKRGGPGAGHVAYNWLRQAMDKFERAAELEPPGHDDAVLRWNTCVRLLTANPTIAPDDEGFRPWLE